MNDLPVALQRPVVSLELALEAKTNRHILLWDDFCGSGLHTITTLSQWLGLEDQKALDEHLASPLSLERGEAFRSKGITLSFGLAMQRGLGEVSEFLARHRLNIAVCPPETALRDEDDGLFSKANIFRTDVERQDLEDFMRKKAREILEPNLTRPERPWGREKVEERLLGYGNTGQLLVFYYNVPSMTLTPLWASHESCSWVPLFSRRTKPAAAKPPAEPTELF